MTIELRDSDDARKYVAQALCLQRVTHPDAQSVRPALEWVLELASGGSPLLPPGMVADFGHVAFHSTPPHRLPVPAGWPATLAAGYEDHVLGKAHSDWTFERAADALRGYEKKQDQAKRDQAKGLAFVIRQFAKRAGLSGVDLSPAVLRGLFGANPADLIAQGFESLAADGPMPVLVEQYEQLISGTRRLADLLDQKDVIALEQRTALDQEGQLYVTHQQILQATEAMESRLPLRPVRPLVGRKELATKLFEEDAYPIGGYTSIANRGSIESLLHSQLAYMEPKETPDLFDVKFVRDELFYYSRDENQFRRRRRAFVFVFPPAAVATRQKSKAEPYHRIVSACGVVLTLARRLTAWLTTDGLRFDVLFVQDGEKKPLAIEAEAMTVLMHDWIDRGDGSVAHVPTLEAAVAGSERLTRQWQTNVLVINPVRVEFEPDGAVTTELVVNGVRPELIDGRGEPIPLVAEEPTDAWKEAAERVLQLWV